MTKTIVLAAVLVAAAATTGCSSMAKAIGATKTTPDEFRVMTQAPLTLPPDYNLRPPQPGAARPGESDPDAEAHAAIFGQDVAQNASPGERALISQAGAEAADASVRDQVDFDSQNIVHRNQAFADAVISMGNAPASNAPLDAAAEQARLADEEAVRRATGGGQVTIQRNAPGGFKLPGT